MNHCSEGSSCELLLLIYSIIYLSYNVVKMLIAFLPYIFDAKDVPYLKDVVFRAENYVLPLEFDGAWRLLAERRASLWLGCPVDMVSLGENGALRPWFSFINRPSMVWALTPAARR